MGRVGAVGPWAGTVEEHLFQFLATLEDVVDGLDSHNGFVEAVAPAAMAAVRVHMDQSVPMPQPAGWDEVTGQLGMGDLEAMHGHSHCSEGTVREDIQDPLGSVAQDSDDVGVENEAVQKTHCFALHGSLG